MKTAATAQKLQVNRDFVTLYLQLLGYGDGDVVRIRFLGGKGFEDLPPEKHECPVQRLDWKKINYLQSRGYGAYLAVNGRFRQEEIQSGRAFFLEWDDIPKTEQWMQLESLEARGLPKPTFVVETRRSIHAYWVLESPVEREAWEAVQKDLITICHADSALKNINRLMRLGGSFHIQAGQSPMLCPVEEMGGVVAFERIKNWVQKERELMTLTLANNEAEAIHHLIQQSPEAQAEIEQPSPPPRRWIWSDF